LKNYKPYLNFLFLLKIFIIIMGFLNKLTYFAPGAYVGIGISLYFNAKNYVSEENKNKLIFSSLIWPISLTKNKFNIVNFINDIEK